MPRPDSGAILTDGRWMEQLDALVVDHGHPNKMRFTAKQDESLEYLRDRGVPWLKIMDFWATHGWRGCIDTLRNRYRELKAAEE